MPILYTPSVQQQLAPYGIKVPQGADNNQIRKIVSSAIPRVKYNIRVLQNKINSLSGFKSDVTNPFAQF